MPIEKKTFEFTHEAKKRRARLVRRCAIIFITLSLAGWFAWHLHSRGQLSLAGVMAYLGISQG